MRKIARRLYRAIPFKQPVFELLRRHVSLPERLYRHLSFTGVIRTQVEDASFRMHHHGYVIENELFWSGIYGSWEGASLRIWVRAARDARVILDVGANTGLYALAAKAVAQSAAVTAFEPVARIREKLQANVDLNGWDIRVDASAISDRDGEGVMLDTGEEHEISATLDPDGEARSGRVRARITVPLARIDTLVARGTIAPPDLLKIDVEGHEPAVLNGMIEQLERHRPALLIEVLSDEAAARVDAIVRPFGYQVYRLDPAGPRRLPSVQPAIGTNLFLCSPATAARVIP